MTPLSLIRAPRRGASPRRALRRRLALCVTPTDPRLVRRWITGRQRVSCKLTTSRMTATHARRGTTLASAFERHAAAMATPTCGESRG